MLLSRAAGYALHPDDVSILLDLQGASPLVQGPGFVQALAESLAALKVLDVQSLQMSPEDCCRAVLEGRAALAVGLPPHGPDGSASRSNPAAVVGTAKLPGATRIYDRSTSNWMPVTSGAVARVTITGFDGFAVCSSAAVDASTRDAAWQFWSSMRHHTTENDIPFGSAICRSADMPAALQKTAPGFTSAEWRRHLETTVAMLQESRVLFDLPLPDAPRFREKLTAHVTDAIEGRATPADALQQVANDWIALIEEIGRERVLSVYRRCHGLSPK
jgi:multiple sugar transport system substrate-binding protein